MKQQTLLVSGLVPLLLLMQQLSYADNTYITTNATRTTQVLATERAANKFEKLPFDEKKYELAYKIYLNNAQTQDAYDLARMAVKSKPASIIWRERLAQTAIWSEHPYVALEQWTNLVLKFQRDEFLQKVIKLGDSLHAYDKLVLLLEYALKKNPHNAVIINNLVNAYNGIGDPDAAILLLKQEVKLNPNKDFYKNLAFLYRQKGDSKNELQVLQYLSNSQGTNSKNVIRMAEINYNQGDISKALQNLHTISNNADQKDPSYWQTTGNMAWLLSNDKLSLAAYRSAYKSNHIDAEGLRRLIVLEQPSNPTMAFKLAKMGWRHYDNAGFLLLTVALGVQLQAWGDLDAIYKNLSPAAVKIISTQADYWASQAIILQRFVGPAKAREFLQKALRQHPELSFLRFVYLQLLVEQLWVNLPQQNPALLPAALKYWENTMPRDRQLWDPYAQAYLMLDQPNNALSIYAAQNPPSATSYAWYIRYADILEKAGYSKEAYAARVNAWNTIVQQLMQHPDIKDDNLIIQFTGLAKYFTGASTAYPPAVALGIKSLATDEQNLLLSWAIDNQNNELAHYLLAYHYPHGAPAWAALNLAIQDNDKKTMAKLLASMSPVLPAVDRVIAAERLDNVPLQQELAYKGAVDQPDNTERYEQLKTAMLKTSDYFEADAEYQQYGSLLGPYSKINAKLFLGPFWSITPYASAWDVRSNDLNQIEISSLVDETAGLILKNQTQINQFSVNLGQRHALTNFFTAFVSDDYKLYHNLTLSGEAGYNQYTTLDDFLQIAGVDDYIKVGATYEVTAHDYVESDIRGDEYYAQNNIRLGDGYTIEGAYNHKIWLGYPDYTLGAFGSLNEYGETHGILTGRILDIVPNNSIASTNLFIPESFWQVGINFHFGDSVRTDYTYAWRPYLSVSLLYDSSSGVGDYADGGFAGSVFGRDKLMIFGSQSRNAQGNSNSNYLAGIRYRVYF